MDEDEVKTDRRLRNLAGYHGSLDAAAAAAGVTKRRVLEALNREANRLTRARMRRALRQRWRRQMTSAHPRAHAARCHRAAGVNRLDAFDPAAQPMVCLLLVWKYQLDLASDWLGVPTTTVWALAQEAVAAINHAERMVLPQGVLPRS